MRVLDLAPLSPFPQMDCLARFQEKQKQFVAKTGLSEADRAKMLTKMNSDWGMATKAGTGTINAMAKMATGKTSDIVYGALDMVTVVSSVRERNAAPTFVAPHR